jgi:hypothetical protein
MPFRLPLRVVLLATAILVTTEAANNSATFVDTWNSSIGHDASKPPGVAWVNGIVPTSLAFPLHPNEMGEANMAQQVLTALAPG